MARKNWKLAAVAAMLAVVATACGSNTPSANGLEGEVTLWHAYGSSGGSAEGTAFADQLAKFETDFPKIKITAVEVPFSDIFTKFKTEAAAGGGPDLFIAPNDELGNLVTAGLLEPITDTTDLGTISQQALDGATIGGKLYLSVLGLHSELGHGYADAVQPIEQRFAELAPALREKYGIRQPVCLYSERNLFMLLLEAGTSVLLTLTTTYGNVKGIAVRV